MRVGNLACCLAHGAVFANHRGPKIHSPPLIICSLLRKLIFGKGRAALVRQREALGFERRDKGVSAYCDARELRQAGGRATCAPGVYTFRR